MRTFHDLLVWQRGMELAELETQSLRAQRLGLLADDDSLRPLIREVSAMLHALIIALERKEATP